MAKSMPKKCIKFISGFLIPNLNNGKFGDHLKWVDKSKNIFQLDWRHKSGPEWTEQEAAVFIEWDKHKGHFHPNAKTYFTQSKQRFRSLLYKLTNDGHLESLKCNDKFKRMYCIVKKKHYKRRCYKSNSLYELCNEDVPSCDMVDNDNVQLDSIYKRRISENDVINVLEDHPYSNIALQDNHTGCEHNQDDFTEHVGRQAHDKYYHLTLNTLNDTQLPEEFLVEDYEIENANATKSSENFQDDFCTIPFNCYKISEDNQTVTKIGNDVRLYDILNFMENDVL